MKVIDIEIRSAGFKYGVPRSNNVLDVSFLQNPAREFGLDSTTDHRHRDFVMGLPETEEFIGIAVKLSEFLVARGDRPVLAFCCSSGRHRSPVIAEEVAERLRDKGYSVEVVHEELK